MFFKIRNTIIKEKLIDDGDNILLALSGGPDSVFLFYMLKSLKEDLRFNLYASHVNHMYRKEEAFRDEEFVSNLCRKYGIKLFIKRKNATEYAEELKLSEEEAGRKLRYDFFYDNIREIGKGKIAVAHNLNDQCETVLQRIIRGTGIDGLKAMSYRSGNIIRPMLNIEKDSIIEYLNANNYEYCEDYTNGLAIYNRNKIRLELIPYLEKNYNPNIIRSLERLSNNMLNDSKIIDKYTNILYNNSLKKIENGKFTLDLKYLNALDDNEIARIIRKAILVFKGDLKNLEQKHINIIIGLIKSNKTGKEVNITENLIAEISYNNLIIRNNAEKIPDFNYKLSIGKTLYVAEVGKSVFLDLIVAKDYVRNDICDYLDYDKICGDLIVRNRRNGDVITPLGVEYKKKLKNIFIDNKVPNEERDRKIIITDQEKIVWVEGYRICNECKVTSNTTKIIKISIK